MLQLVGSGAIRNYHAHILGTGQKGASQQKISWEIKII
jgi:hypothetical protein